VTTGATHPDGPAAATPAVAPATSATVPGTASGGTGRPSSRWVGMADPLMAPVLAELTDTYLSLYGPGARLEMTRHPAEAFSPPGGGVLVLVEDGVAVAAGALRARGPALRGEPGPGTGPGAGAGTADGGGTAGGAGTAASDPVAEVKRMWTAPAHRRRGLARRVLAELEDAARAAGYTAVYVSTGWRQTEAVALYLRAGYRPLFDPDGDPAVPFERGFLRDL